MDYLNTLHPAFGITQGVDLQNKTNACEDEKPCCDGCLFPDKLSGTHLKDTSPSILGFDFLLPGSFPDSCISNTTPSFSRPLLEISSHSSDFSTNDSYQEKDPNLTNIPFNNSMHFNLEHQIDSDSNHLGSSQSFLYPDEYLQIGTGQLSSEFAPLRPEFATNYFFPDESVGPTFQLNNVKIVDTSMFPERRNFGQLSIVEYRKHPIYQTGSYYGRSIGTTNDGQKLLEPCSGWNIGGPYLITAAHCNRTKRNIGGEVTAIYRWGLYDEGFSLLDPQKGLVDDKGKQVRSTLVVGKKEREDRYEDLGFPRSSINDFLCKLEDSELKGKIPPESIRGWPLEEKDIDYLRCERKRTSFTAGGRKQEASILPVHIFDAIPIYGFPEQSITKGRNNYLLHFNQPPKHIHGRAHVLLSSGGNITDVNKTWARFESENIDASGGSSGGAFIDEETNLAFGVASNIIRSEQSPNIWTRGYFVQPKTYKYSDPNQWTRVIEGDLQGLPYFTQFVGDQNLSLSPLQKNQSILTCPKNYAAAGVIGSTIEDSSKEKSLGSFGLICLPINKSTHYQFEHAIVISNSSFDAQWTGATKARSNPVTSYHRFDTYINRYLSAGKLPPFLSPPIRKPQSFTMCAPGYYLNGILASERLFPDQNNQSEKRVEQVLLLSCSQWEQNSPNYLRVPRQNIGGPHASGLQGIISVKQSSNAISKTLACPQGYFVDGFESNPLDFTTKFIRLRCRKPTGTS